MKTLPEKTRVVNMLSNLGKLFLLAAVLGFLSINTTHAEVVVYETSDLHTTNSDTSKVYNVVDEMPQIVGGLNEIYKHIEYPELAVKSGVEGRVYIQFIVTEAGEVRNPKVIKDIGAGCGEAAVEGIKKVKFTPGKLQGQIVKVQFTMPITFKFD